MSGEPTTWAQLTALMYGCLVEARNQLSCLVDPTTEDIRCVGISLFIEARKNGIQLPLDVRFRNKVRELEMELDDPDTLKRVLHEHGVSDIYNITDADTMTAVVNALHEEIAAAQPQKET